jgi:hypothetical protein
VIVRRATPADIASFYGAAEVPLDMLVLWDGDEAIAMAGVCWLEDGAYVALVLRQVARRYPKQLMRAARVVRALIENLGVPVYAERDPDEPTADRLLRHCGFEPDGRRYVYAVSLDGRRVRGAVGVPVAARAA